MGAFRLIALLSFIILQSCGIQQSIVSELSSQNYLRLERGKLPLNQNAKIQIVKRQRVSEIYRIVTYQDNGNLQLHLDTNENDIFLEYEGPLTTTTDTAPFIATQKLQLSSGNNLITFDSKGAYRLRFISHTLKSIPIHASCHETCNLEEITPNEFLEMSQGQLDQFLDQFLTQLPSEEKQKIKLQILNYLASQSGLNQRSLVVSQNSSEYVSLLQLWQQKQAPAPSTDVYNNIDVSELFESCDKPARPAPTDLKLEYAPGWHYDYPADWSLSPCQADHSIKLAKILNSILSQPQTHGLRYHGSKIQDISHLFKLMIDDGQEVELNNEKMYADFLAFSKNNQWLRWPLWIDTGISNPSTGMTIQIPMGHSQYSFVIKGPKIEASVSFFLGLFGSGYFANITKRAAWTGFKVLHTLRSPESLLQMASMTEKFYKQIKEESAKNPVGPFADGYVLRGVCNDSAGILEMTAQRLRTPGLSFTQISGYSFPYTRQRIFDIPVSASQLDVKYRDSNDFDVKDLLAHLPRDIHNQNSLSNAEKINVFCRILAMNPLPSEQNVLGMRLKADIRYIEEQVAGKCPNL